MKVVVGQSASLLAEWNFCATDKSHHAKEGVLLWGKVQFCPIADSLLWTAQLSNRVEYSLLRISKRVCIYPLQASLKAISLRLPQRSTSTWSIYHSLLLVGLGNFFSSVLIPFVCRLVRHLRLQSVLLRRKDLILNSININIGRLRVVITSLDRLLTFVAGRDLLGRNRSGHGPTGLLLWSTTALHPFGHVLLWGFDVHNSTGFPVLFLPDKVSC